MGRRAHFISPLVAIGLALSPGSWISSATASPIAAPYGGYSLAPPSRILVWPEIPKFPIADDLYMPNGFTEVAQFPSAGDTIDAARLFGDAAPDGPERAVAKAACRAMNQAFLGTGRKGFWENAIRSNVENGEFEGEPSAQMGIDFAVERAASAVWAAQSGEGLVTFYADTCHQRIRG